MNKLNLQAGTKFFLKSINNKINEINTLLLHCTLQEIEKTKNI